MKIAFENLSKLRGRSCIHRPLNFCNLCEAWCISCDFGNAANTQEHTKDVDNGRARICHRVIDAQSPIADLPCDGYGSCKSG